jgi:hypothetical protein
MAAPAPASTSSGLTGRQKRIAYAIGAGALLAVFLLLRNRGGGGGGSTAAGPAPTVDPSAATMPAGSTFADNGPAMADLNTTLSGLAGDVQTVSDQLSSFEPPATQPAAGAVAAPASPLVVLNIAPSGMVASAAPGAGVGGKAPTPATKTVAIPKGYTAVGRPQVNTSANARAGQTFQVVKKGRVTYHYYPATGKYVAVSHT